MQFLGEDFLMLSIIYVDYYQSGNMQNKKAKDDIIEYLSKLTLGLVNCDI